jgi:hypothetical protein
VIDNLILALVSDDFNDRLCGVTDMPFDYRVLCEIKYIVSILLSSLFIDDLLEVDGRRSVQVHLEDERAVAPSSAAMIANTSNIRRWDVERLIR